MPGEVLRLRRPGRERCLIKRLKRLVSKIDSWQRHIRVAGPAYGIILGGAFVINAFVGSIGAGCGHGFGLPAAIIGGLLVSNFVL
jgi:hypothetical protein